MASFEIRISQPAEAEFLAVPFPFRRQINQAIHKLKTRPIGPPAEAVAPPIHRLAVHGWFILYAADEETKTVTILRICR